MIRANLYAPSMPKLLLLITLMLLSLSLALIWGNGNYLESTAKTERLDGVNSLPEPIDAAQADLQAGEWRLATVSLGKKFANPVYFNVKTLTQQNGLVFFWQKQIFDQSSARSEASLRIGVPVAEAEEFFQADCRQNTLNGPLMGLYWQSADKPILDPDSHTPLWKFKPRRFKPVTPENRTLSSVCDYAAQQF